MGPKTIGQHFKCWNGENGFNFQVDVSRSTTAEEGQWEIHSKVGIKTYRQKHRFIYELYR